MDSANQPPAEDNKKKSAPSQSKASSSTSAGSLNTAQWAQRGMGNVRHIPTDEELLQKTDALLDRLNKSQNKISEGLKRLSKTD